MVLTSERPACSPQLKCGLIALTKSDRKRKVHRPYRPVGGACLTQSPRVDKSHLTFESAPECIISSAITGWTEKIRATAFPFHCQSQSYMLLEASTVISATTTKHLDLTAKCCSVSSRWTSQTAPCYQTRSGSRIVAVQLASFFFFPQKTPTLSVFFMPMSTMFNSQHRTLQPPLIHAEGASWIIEDTLQVMLIQSLGRYLACILCLWATMICGPTNTFSLLLVLRSKTFFIACFFLSSLWADLSLSTLLSGKC